MATEDYIPVAADDWYQRRRDDEEGKFFRDVANQGPRKGEGGATRQGIYCLTADGKLLAYKNAGQAPEVMRDTLRQGLREWNKLAEERRKPGGTKVADVGKTDALWRAPPRRWTDRQGLHSHTRPGKGRVLSRDVQDARWREGGPRPPVADRGGVEIARFRPIRKRVTRSPLPAKIAERILRFHLTDNTRGEPPMWRARTSARKT